MAPTVITPRELTPEILAALATESGYLELLSEPAIEFDDYQREFLEDMSRFQIYLKGRQLGFSYVAAARTLARSQLIDNYTAVIASYKADDAKEKIRYVKQMYDSLPDAYKKDKLVDNATSIEFVNKAGRQSTGSRIIAQGKGPIRGKGGGFLDVILDEFAFFGAFDGIVYDSTVPVFTRVKHGSLTIISTPLGKSGKFYDIWSGGSGGKKHRNYKRRAIYWWDFSLLCKDVQRARREAKNMHTLQRVELFGTDQLHELFDAMDLEAFQQEFECAFIDETNSYFPLEMIYKCVMDDEIPDGKVNSEQQRLMAESLNELRDKTSGRLGGGYDVGRRKDASELTALDQTDTTKILRYMATYKQSDFELQERELDRFIEIANPVRVCIDENGIGMQLAEGRRKKHGSRVEPVAFTNAGKETMAVSLHREFEKGRSGILIPNDLDLISQIVSIRREVTSNGAFRYSADRNDKHHGDKFWSLALSNYALDERNKVVITPPIAFSYEELMDGGYDWDAF